MNCLSAAVLLSLAGKPIDEKSVKAVIESVKGKADDAAIKKLVEKLKGKDVLKFAKENLAKLGSGSASASTGAPTESADAKKEDKKDDKKGGDKKGGDKKKEEPKKKVVEDDDDGDVGFGGLF